MFDARRPAITSQPISPSAGLQCLDLRARAAIDMGSNGLAGQRGPEFEKPGRMHLRNPCPVVRRALTWQTVRGKLRTSGLWSLRACTRLRRRTGLQTQCAIRSVRLLRLHRPGQAQVLGGFFTDPGGPLKRLRLGSLLARVGAQDQGRGTHQGHVGVACIGHGTDFANHGVVLWTSGNVVAAGKPAAPAGMATAQHNLAPCPTATFTWPVTTWPTPGA